MSCDALCTGNQPELAAACAGSLLDIDEGSAGHEDAWKYYTPAGRTHALAERMFQLDTEAFHYRFNITGPYGVAYPLPV